MMWTEAVKGVSPINTVLPDFSRVSCALPTFSPATSVIRLRGPGRIGAVIGRIRGLPRYSRETSP